ncbi:VOC family protein [bacterium]|nr:VOC family protein [bacterium]
MFKRITLSSPHPEKAARFLCEALGHERPSGTGPVLVSRGGAEVVLVKGPSSTPPIIFSVMSDSFEKTTDGINAAGGKLVRELVGKRRSRFFHAPGGLLIEVVLRRKQP